MQPVVSSKHHWSTSLVRRLITFTWKVTSLRWSINPFRHNSMALGKGESLLFSKSKSTPNATYKRTCSGIVKMIGFREHVDSALVLISVTLKRVHHNLFDPSSTGIMFSYLGDDIHSDTVDQTVHVCVRVAVCQRSQFVHQSLGHLVEGTHKAPQVPDNDKQWRRRRAEMWQPPFLSFFFCVCWRWSSQAAESRVHDTPLFVPMTISLGCGKAIS